MGQTIYIPTITLTDTEAMLAEYCLDQVARRWEEVPQLRHAARVLEEALAARRHLARTRYYRWHRRLWRWLRTSPRHARAWMLKKRQEFLCSVLWWVLYGGLAAVLLWGCLC